MIITTGNNNCEIFGLLEENNTDTLFCILDERNIDWQFVGVFFIFMSDKKHLHS